MFGAKDGCCPLGLAGAEPVFDGVKTTLIIPVGLPCSSRSSNPAWLYHVSPIFTPILQVFPSGEFGYISGVLTKLGSDVLPPDQQSQQYRFPATVSLKEQTVESGDQKLNLQSGMGVTANIKLRSRPVISIISDLFTKQLDGVKRFR